MVKFPFFQISLLFINMTQDRSNAAAAVELRDFFGFEGANFRIELEHAHFHFTHSLQDYIVDGALKMDFF